MTRDTPLSDLGFSPVALRALYDMDIRTVGDAAETEITVDIKGVGPGTLNRMREVRDQLHAAERPRCERCRHWIDGTCHRYPPALVQMQFQPRPSNPARGVWPQTAATDLCGEFEAD